MKRLFVLLALVALTATGCATAQWTATGGSRADATVDISYESGLGMLEPKNDVEAHQMAVQRCKSWGYADAEAFGGVTRVKNGEYTYLVTKTFQCLGQGAETDHAQKVQK